MSVSRDHEQTDCSVTSGWQPIQSAPTDGTWFLAYRPSADVGVWNTVVAVTWSGDAEDFVWPVDTYDAYSPPDLSETDGSGWFVADVYEGLGSFTHWMPLPNPPSSAEQVVVTDPGTK